MIGKWLKARPGGVRVYREPDADPLAPAFSQNKIKVMSNLVVDNDAPDRMNEPGLDPILWPVLHQMYLNVASRLKANEIQRVMPERIRRKRPIGDIKMDPVNIRLNEPDFFYGFVPRRGIDGGNDFNHSLHACKLRFV